jgi:hypothetical protein
VSGLNIDPAASLLAKICFHAVRNTGTDLLVTGSPSGAPLAFLAEVSSCFTLYSDRGLSMGAKSMAKPLGVTKSGMRVMARRVQPQLARASERRKGETERCAPIRSAPKSAA